MACKATDIIEELNSEFGTGITLGSAYGKIIKNAVKIGESYSDERKTYEQSTAVSGSPVLQENTHDKLSTIQAAIKNRNNIHSNTKEFQKSLVANKFIGEGAANSSTGFYQNQYEAQELANLEEYTEDDVVFVSINGGRKDAISAFDEKGNLQGVYKNIDEAMNANATIILDTYTAAKGNFNKNGEGKLYDYMNKDGNRYQYEKIHDADWTYKNKKDEDVDYGYGKWTPINRDETEHNLELDVLQKLEESGRKAELKKREKEKQAKEKTAKKQVLNQGDKVFIKGKKNYGEHEIVKIFKDRKTKTIKFKIKNKNGKTFIHIRKSLVPKTIKKETVKSKVDTTNIKRIDLKNNPNTVFLFGDNLLEKGLGGQAKEMRGEPNAYGIPTKKLPSMNSNAFFTDKEYDKNIKAINDAINKIPKNKTIVIPKNGIGTGLAKLKEKAPKTFKYLQDAIKNINTTETKKETVLYENKFVVDDIITLTTKAGKVINYRVTKVMDDGKNNGKVMLYNITDDKQLTTMRNPDLYTKVEDEPIVKTTPAPNDAPFQTTETSGSTENFDEKLNKKLQSILKKLYPNIKLEYTTDEIGYNQDGLNQESINNDVKLKLKVVEGLEKISPVRSKIRLNTKDKPYIERNLSKALLGRGVPQNQIDLIFEYMRQNNLEEINTKELSERIMLELTNNVKIKTATDFESIEKPDGSLFFITKDEIQYHATDVLFQNKRRRIYKKKPKGKMWDYTTEKEFEEARKEASEETNTSHYKDLTVEGGKNYREVEISTPGLVAPMQGHAEFATDNGIGWYRVDDAISKIDFNSNKSQKTIPKTLRILEMQSDMFQKMKDKTLNKSNNFAETDKIFRLNGYTYRPKIIQNFSNGEAKLVGYVKKSKGGEYAIIKEEEYYNAFEEKYNESFDSYFKPKIELNKSFLQILNTNNKWVRFFIQSIVQDAQKNGYKNIRFPAGETAAKVEGHETLVEQIKDMKDKIETLNSEIQSLKDDPRDGDDVKINERIDRIKSIESEIKQTKTEGIEKLAPIEAFYQNRVHNTLINTYGKENVKTIKDEYGNNWFELNIKNNRDSDTILLQENKGRIKGQANIKAQTVLINSLLQSQDTLPHEYAHHYIAMFRDAPIVQEGIKKWGSEEKLVQAIGEQVVEQKGEAYGWWKEFAIWVQSLFNKLDNKTKEELRNILTDAFLTNGNLGEKTKVDGEPEVYNQLMENTYETLNKNVPVAELRQSIVDGNKLAKLALKSPKWIRENTTFIPGAMHPNGYVKYGAKIVYDGLEVSVNPIDNHTDSKDIKNRKLKTGFDSFTAEELSELPNTIKKASGSSKQLMDNVKYRLKNKKWREEQNRDTFVPKELQTIAEEILDISFPNHKHLAKDYKALPYITNLANNYAKSIDKKYYDIKNPLVDWMSRHNPKAWSKGDGVVYVEGDIGQVSFHVFNNEDKKALEYGDNPFNKKWSGIPAQAQAEAIMQKYIDSVDAKPTKQDNGTISDKLQKLKDENIIVGFGNNNKILSTIDREGKRVSIIANVNGTFIPFYQSSSGTDGKTTGKWYPYFGRYNVWMVKGTLDELENGYNNSYIKNIQDRLNKEFNNKSIVNEIRNYSSPHQLGFQLNKKIGIPEKPAETNQKTYERNKKIILDKLKNDKEIKQLDNGTIQDIKLSKSSKDLIEEANKIKDCKE